MKSARKPRPKATGTLVGVRLQTDDLDRLDQFIARQPGPLTRPQAVRIALHMFLEREGVAPSGKGLDPRT